MIFEKSLHVNTVASKAMVTIIATIFVNTIARNFEKSTVAFYDDVKYMYNTFRIL